MVIEIDSDLKGSILDIGGGGEAVIGQIYGNRVTAIDNCQEEIDEAPDCCTKLLMDAGNRIHTSYGIVKPDTQSSDSIIQLLKNAGLNIISLKVESGQFSIQCIKE